MKQHLYTKLLILYFMLGGICFLLLSSGGSYLVEKRLERSTGESLYRTASQLVSKNELRQAVKSPKNKSLTLALSSAAAFQNADFWVMDTDGNVLINTNQQSSDSGDITVRNFRPEDYEDTCYSSGTFYGILKTTQLSTVVPIKDTDLVTGYLVIHYPMKNLYESRSNIVEVMVLIFIVIYALFFSFLLIYFYRVHKPLKEILKGALEFANGNLTYTIPVDSEDEMGYLSHSLNYMADKLNKNGEYQRQFISNVSHDFRSPLTSIKGYVEAMLDGTIPPEMQERYLKVIAFESTRLEKLTRSLLTLNELDVKKRMMHINRLSRRASSADLRRCSADSRGSGINRCPSRSQIRCTSRRAKSRRASAASPSIPHRNPWYAPWAAISALPPASHNSRRASAHARRGRAPAAPTPRARRPSPRPKNAARRRN